MMVEESFRRNDNDKPISEERWKEEVIIRF